MMPAKEARHSYGLNGRSRRRPPNHSGSANMSLQPLKLNVEDRRVYETWRRNIILLWAFIVGTMAIVCTVPALDAAVTPEQRAMLIQQSGLYP
jgi:hypothetical protein